MNRLDTMLYKAQPKPSIIEKLEQDNPYLEYSFDELLDMMDGETEIETNHAKFIHAVTVKFCQLEPVDEEVYCQESDVCG